MKYIALENHPADSRVKIMEDDICQTLSSRMGTGGGNLPMILEVKDDSSRFFAKSGDESAWNGIRD